jgi:hypothetical protein
MYGATADADLSEKWCQDVSTTIIQYAPKDILNMDTKLNFFCNEEPKGAKHNGGNECKGRVMILSCSEVDCNEKLGPLIVRKSGEKHQFYLKSSKKYHYSYKSSRNA